MVYAKFSNTKKYVPCVVVPETEHVLRIEFKDTPIVNTDGFRLYLDPDGELDIGGDTYLKYTTIYRNDETTAKYNGYELSNDGSVYVPPTYEVTVQAHFSDNDNERGLRPEKVSCVLTYGGKKNTLSLTKDHDYKAAITVLEKAEYTLEASGVDEYTYMVSDLDIYYTIEPALEEICEQKVVELNDAQQAVISGGVDVQLSDGTVEHFTLTSHDQLSLMGLQSEAMAGKEYLPWHNSDQSEGCKYYSNADMQTIDNMALNFISFHVTYFRDLRIMVRDMKSKEAVRNAYYMMPIPEEYQSQPLKDMLAVIPDPFIYRSFLDEVDE